MKGSLITLAFLAIFLLNACQKETIDTPGNIPGMGNTPGELQVKQAYNLPGGVYLVGDITGEKSPIGKAGEMIESFGDAKAVYSIFGSGGAVRLKISLFNSRTYPVTVFFPKGLLFRCNFGNFQHGLCAQTTWACIQPNSSRSIYLDMYCLNYGIPSPDQTAKYSILGITSSQTIWNMLNLIGWRKVNYEMIFGSQGKGIKADEPSYEEIIERIQAMVHDLTNFANDLTSDDKAFIQSISELSSSEIPQLDVDLQYPEYFDEFVVPED